MKEYSVENMITLTGENQDLIRSFLTSLTQAGKSDSLVRDYHSRLHKFFKSRNDHLASIKMEEIEKWIAERQQEWKESTIENHLRCLRSFFNFCVGEGYIEKSPIPNTKKAKVYWEIKQRFQNSENHQVINAYLLRLKEGGKKKKQIIQKRTVLQMFFRNREKSFSSITTEDIQKWVSDHDGDWLKGTLENYMSHLRSFYGFCEQEGYMENPPLKKTKWVMSAEKYWEIQQPFANKQNQGIVNQFLLHLKNTNQSKSTIVGSRCALQVFFREIKELYSAVTPEVIQSWADKYQANVKRHTVVNHLSFLRSFYRFGLKQGYVEKSPVLYQWVRDAEEKYWELKEELLNAENQDVINDFLLSMKLVNMSRWTIVKYRSFLWGFFNARKESFKSLVPEDIQVWLINPENRWSESTTVSYLGMLSTFFKYCVGEGYMEKAPIKRYWYPRLPKPVPKYLGKEDITKLRFQSETEKLRNRVIIEFLLATGCRIGEIYGLDRVNVDLENRMAHVCGKGKKIRTVHFTEKCAWLLERYLESREDNEPALFVSEWETRIGKRQLYTIINSIGTRAELSVNLHPHRLRHTFATELLAKGADISFIADALGHNDIQTTQIYAQLPEGELVAMYRKYMG